MKRTHLLVAVAVIIAIVVCSVLACIVGVGGPVALIFGSLKANPAYTMGMDLVKNDPAVIELFGSPVQDGFFVDGSILGYPEGNTANLQTSISGPKARGMVYIYGTQADKGGLWQIDSVNIRIDDKPVLSYKGSEAEKGFQPVR